MKTHNKQNCATLVRSALALLLVALTPLSFAGDDIQRLATSALVTQSESDLLKATSTATASLERLVADKGFLVPTGTKAVIEQFNPRRTRAVLQDGQHKGESIWADSLSVLADDVATLHDSKKGKGNVPVYLSEEAFRKMKNATDIFMAIGRGEVFFVPDGTKVRTLQRGPVFTTIEIVDGEEHKGKIAVAQNEDLVIKGQIRLVAPESGVVFVSKNEDNQLDFQSTAAKFLKDQLADGKSFAVSAGTAIQLISFGADASGTIKIKIVEGQHAGKEGWTHLKSLLPAQPDIASNSKWPPIASTLTGNREVRITNPNEFRVKVGLRSENAGRDFTVAANSNGSVFVPDGRYDIYFQYSTDPDGLYQGDGFTLTGQGVEIKIVKVVDGNYGIRKIK